MQSEVSNEQWRDIPGFEGSYRVSDLGRVESLARVIERVHPETGELVPVHISGRILKPAQSKSGHLSVVLGREGGTKLVHALVMLAFVGPYPDGMEILHKDGDPSNNRRANLRYGTRGENIEDDLRHGVHRIAKYPFLDMKVGDAFFAPISDFRDAATAFTSIRSAASQWRIRTGKSSRFSYVRGLSESGVDSIKVTRWI